MLKSETTAALVFATRADAAETNGPSSTPYSSGLPVASLVCTRGSLGCESVPLQSILQGPPRRRVIWLKTSPEYSEESVRPGMGKVSHRGWLTGSQEPGRHPHGHLGDWEPRKPYGALAWHKLANSPVCLQNKCCFFRATLAI
ncbi:unnamed protein product [Gadus morhua 'NCC']